MVAVIVINTSLPLGIESTHKNILLIKGVCASRGIVQQRGMVRCISHHHYCGHQLVAKWLKYLTTARKVAGLSHRRFFSLLKAYSAVISRSILQPYTASFGGGCKAGYWLVLEFSCSFRSLR